MIDIAIILCCWTISFLFAGIEAGILSIDPVRLRHRVKQDIPAAVRLNALLRKPERLFVTVLLITNMANILGLLLLTRSLVAMFGSIGFLWALLIALPIYLFLLGVFPKSLFRRFPFRALAALAGVLELISLILWPVLELGGWLVRLIMPRRATERGRLFAAREELKQITTQSEREGALTATERAMIHNVVDFRAVKVRDVMVPLQKIVSVPPDISVQEALKLSNTSGVDRLPVITRSGEVLGLVNALDILLERDKTRSLAQQTRRIVTADEDEPGYRVMQRLRAARLGLAGVFDRNRKLCGIVTTEDLIRRLVRSA
jgi:CBS domain containing-hemolysin-like protein